MAANQVPDLSGYFTGPDTTVAPKPISNRQQVPELNKYFDKFTTSPGKGEPSPIDSNAFGPSYTRNYFETYSNLAQFHQGIQGAPKGFEFPDWMDVEGIETAFTALSAGNDTSDWTQWGDIDVDSPVGQFLRGIPEPPPEYRNWYEFKEPDPMNFMFGIKPSLYEGSQEGSGQDLTGLQPSIPIPYAEGQGMLSIPESEVDFENLPGSHKWFYNVLSSPTLTGMANMSPMVARSVGGAALGWALTGGNPAGGIIGGMGALAFGAVTGAMADPRVYDFIKNTVDIFTTTEYAEQVGMDAQKVGMGALYYMDIGAIWAERSMGAAYQMYDLKEKGMLDELTNATMKAYNEGGLRHAYYEELEPYFQAGEIFYESLTGIPEVGKYIQNLPYGAEWLIDSVAGGVRDERWAESGEVILPGVLEPYTPSAYGVAAMNIVRNQILAGDDWQMTVMNAQKEFGIGGVLADLGFQIYIDPANLVPGGARAAVGKYAHMIQSPMLATAIETTSIQGGGPFSIAKNYRNVLSSGIIDTKYTEMGWTKPDFKDYTRLQKWWGGVSPEGAPVRLYAPTVKPRLWNPVSWMKWATQMSPDAKISYVVNANSRINAMIMERAGGNIDVYIKNMEEFLGVKHGEIATVMKEIGMTGDMIVAQNASRGATKNIIQMFAEYHAGRDAGYFQGGNEYSRVTGNPIVELVAEYEGRPDQMGEAIFGALSNAEIDVDPVVLALFDPVSPTKIDMEAFAKYFKSNSWNPTQIMGRVNELMGAATWKYAKENLGIKPSSQLQAAWDAARAGQAFLVFWANPAWLFNNFVNNEMTLLLDRNFNHMSPDKVDAELAQWNLHVPEIRRVFAGTEIGGESVTESMREVQQATGRGFFVSVADGLDAVNSWSPLMISSRWVEQRASAGGFYSAFKQFMNRNWSRNQYVPQMPTALVNAITTMGGKNSVNLIYSMVENAKTQADINNIRRGLLGEMKRSMTPYFEQVAGELDLSIGELRNILADAGVESRINDNLEAGMSMDLAVDDALQFVEKYTQDSIQAEIMQRAVAAATATKGEGAAKISDVLNELAFTRSRVYEQGFVHMETMWNEVLGARKLGVDPAPIFDRYFRSNNASYQNHNATERATYAGIMDAWGFLDPNDKTSLSPAAMNFMTNLDAQYKHWDGFYEFRESEIKRVRTNQYTDQAWAEAKENIFNRYVETLRTDAEAIAENAELMVQLVDAQYRGVGAEDGRFDNLVRVMQDWRDGVIDGNLMRQQMMLNMREFEMGKPLTRVDETNNAAFDVYNDMVGYFDTMKGKQPRVVWQKFLKEKLLLLQAAQIGRMHTWGDWVYEAANGRVVETQNTAAPYVAPPDRTLYHDMVVAREVMLGDNPVTSADIEYQQLNKFIVENTSQATGDAINNTFLALSEALDTGDIDAIDKARLTWESATRTGMYEIANNIDFHYQENAQTPPYMAVAKLKMQEHTRGVTFELEDSVLDSHIREHLEPFTDKDFRINYLVETHGYDTETAEIENHMLETVAEFWASERGKDPAKFFEMLYMADLDPAKLPGDVRESLKAKAGSTPYAFQTVLADGKRVIATLNEGDPTRFMHELWHVYDSMILTEGQRASMLEIARGIDPKADPNEIIAEAYVKWRTDGTAPNWQSQSIFAKFQRFAQNFIDRVKGFLGINRDSFLGKLDTQFDTEFQELFGEKIWEYTRDEYVDWLPEDHYLMPGPYIDDKAGFYDSQVRSAIEDGKFVIPPDVLAQYPDLKSKYDYNYDNGFLFSGLDAPAVVPEKVSPHFSQSYHRDTAGWRKYVKSSSPLVKNADGTLKVYYHGTSSPGFSYYDPSKADAHALYGPGFYLTDSPAVAGGVIENDYKLNVVETQQEAQQLASESKLPSSAYPNPDGTWTVSINEWNLIVPGYSATGADATPIPEAGRQRYIDIINDMESYQDDRQNLWTMKDRAHADAIIDSFMLTGDMRGLIDLDYSPFHQDVLSPLAREGLVPDGSVYPLFAGLKNPLNLDTRIRDINDVNYFLNMFADTPWAGDISRVRLIEDVHAKSQTLLADDRYELSVSHLYSYLKDSLYVQNGGYQGYFGNVQAENMSLINEMLGMRGYDGIVSDGSISPTVGGNIAVAFYSEDVKSVFNEGDFSRQKRDFYAQTGPKDAGDPGPVFSEKLRDSVEGAKQNKMPPNQWINYLQSPKRGVRATEIEWTGLGEYLEGKKSVTKEEILGFLDSHATVLRTVYFMPNARDAQRKVAAEIYPEMQQLVDESTAVEKKLDAYLNMDPADFDPNSEDLRELRRTKMNLEDRISTLEIEMNVMIRDAPHGGYTTQGGKNYRVMSVVQENPGAQRALLEAEGYEIETVTMKTRLGDEIPKFYIVKHRTTGTTQVTAPTLSMATRHLIGRNTRDTYDNDHFGVPDTIGFIRTTDHMTESRGNMLLVENLQSDWAKEYYYMPQLPKGEIPKGWRIEGTSYDNVYIKEDEYYGWFSAYIESTNQDLNTKFVKLYYAPFRPGGNPVELSSSIAYAYAITLDNKFLALLRSEHKWKMLAEARDTPDLAFEDIIEHHKESFVPEFRIYDEVDALKAVDIDKDIALFEATQGFAPPLAWDTDWHKLLIRRAVRYAAANGYNSVGFVGSDTMLERWGTDLVLWERNETAEGEKFINVNYEGRVDEGHASAMDDQLFRDNYYNMRNRMDSKKQLIEYLQDNAQRTESTKVQMVKLADVIWDGDKDVGYMMPRKEFMEMLYDEKIPNYLKKLAKKHKADTTSQGIYRDTVPPDGYEIIVDGGIDTVVVTQEDVDLWLEMARDEGYIDENSTVVVNPAMISGDPIPTEHIYTPTTLEINPAMKESVKNGIDYFHAQAGWHNQWMNLASKDKGTRPGYLEPMTTYTGNKRSAAYAGTYSRILPASLISDYNSTWDIAVGSGLVSALMSQDWLLPTNVNDYSGSIAAYHTILRDNPEVLTNRVDAYGKTLTAMYDATNGNKDASLAAKKYIRDLHNKIKNNILMNDDGARRVFDWSEGRGSPALGNFEYGNISIPPPEFAHDGSGQEISNDFVFGEWLANSTFDGLQGPTQVGADGTWVNIPSKLKVVADAFRHRHELAKSKQGVVRITQGDMRDVVDQILKLDPAEIQKTLVIIDPPYPKNKYTGAGDSRSKEYTKYWNAYEGIEGKAKNTMVPESTARRQDYEDIGWAVEFIENDLRRLHEAGVPYIYTNHAMPEIRDALMDIPGVLYNLADLNGQGGTRLEISAFPAYMWQKLENRLSPELRSKDSGYAKWLHDPLKREGENRHAAAMFDELFPGEPNKAPKYEMDYLPQEVALRGEQDEARPGAEMADDIAARVPEFLKKDYFVHNLPSPVYKGDDIPIYRYVYQMGTDGKPEFVAYQSGAEFNQPAQEIDGGRMARLIGFDDENNFVFDIRDKDNTRLGIEKISRTWTDPDSLGPLTPTAMDSLVGKFPLGMVQDDGNQQYIRPALSELRRAHAENPDPLILPEEYAEMTGGDRKSFDGWLDDSSTALSKTKVAGRDYGLMMKNQSLLNYQDKTNLDMAISTGFPYAFWWTNQFVNWSLRVLDKPALLSHFSKIVKLGNKLNDENKDMPERLKEKWEVSAPWAPEWSGQKMFVDVIGKTIPLFEMLRPFEMLINRDSREVRKAESYINKLYYDGTLDLDAAKAALLSHEGIVWDQAIQYAVREEGTDLLDNLGAFTSPALWLSIPYRLATGTTEKLNPLPMSRTIQGLATATGIDALKLLDFEKYIRDKVGLNQFGEWGPYYVDRQLANLAAENPQHALEIEAQMIAKAGPWYDEAMQRVQFEMMMRQPGMAPIYAARKGGLGDVLGSMLFGWVPSGMLPEGELHQRGLYPTYKQATADYNAGDKAAYDKFFEQHPEYQVRMALFKEPKERMHEFLKSQVWDAWYRLPPATQEEAKAGLGDTFATMFINEETRDYEGISNETMAWWAHTLGGVVPGDYKPPDKKGVAMPPEQISMEYQKYLATKDAKYPGVGDLNKAYFTAPPEMQEWMRDNTNITDYWSWRKRYQHENPEMIPYMVTEKSRIYGADPQTAQLYFAYEVQFMEDFPDYYKDLDTYFDTGYKSKSLQAAWDFKNNAIKNFPTLLPLLEDDPEGITRVMKYQDVTPQDVTGISIMDMSPPMRESLYNHFVFGDDLGVGVMTELLRLYGNAGIDQPFDEWVGNYGKLYESQK